MKTYILASTGNYPKSLLSRGHLILTAKKKKSNWYKSFRKYNPHLNADGVFQQSVTFRGLISLD